MKIKDGFLLKEIAGDFMVVPVGENLVDFCAMIILNETGVFLWKQLNEDINEEQLIEAVLKEYDIDKESATQDVNNFINDLKQKDLVV